MSLLHRYLWSPPIKHTEWQDDKQPYMPPLPSPPPSAYPGNPFPSSSQLSGKSMNTEGHLWRQVRISLSKPHNAIKPTTNQSTHGWLACAYTPLIPDDLRLHHICGRCFPEFMFLFFICFLINISCNYFILKYCNFIFFFLCRLDYLCLIGPVHT